MNNHFLIICCFYNASEFIERCVASILYQNYSNYTVLFIDDASTDKSLDLIPNNSKFIKIRNEENKGLLYNYVTYLPIYANQNDIVVVVDGDDALYDLNVLTFLNNYYNEHNCLVTYGQSLWTDGRKGFARPYKEQEFNNLRKNQFLASHLRTFKYTCFKELTNQDPNFDCFKDNNGNFYMMAGDVATMYPIMEIAGFERVKYIDKILYLYNIQNPISDHMKNQQLQWDINNEINNKKNFITL
jgi:glycosyltransferase involved in cell wall biosynthesis